MHFFPLYISERANKQLYTHSLDAGHDQNMALVQENSSISVLLVRMD